MKPQYYDIMKKRTDKNNKNSYWRFQVAHFNVSWYLPLHELETYEWNFEDVIMIRFPSFNEVGFQNDGRNFQYHRNTSLYIHSLLRKYFSMTQSSAIRWPLVLWSNGINC